MKTKNIPKQLLAEDDKSHLKTTAARAYSDQKKQSTEDEYITEFMPMVPKIVQRVVSYIKPPLSFEDLVSAGFVGLIKAAKDYNPSYQAEFKTYAYIRIRGAVLDELREWSFVPANRSKQIHEALDASQKIAGKTGSVPTDERLAEKLEISIDQLHKTFESARTQHFLSIDSFSDDKPVLGSCLAAPNAARPEENIEKEELVDGLAEAIQKLRKKQRQTILLYYQQNLTMKEIAEVLKITESRVSQLHANALFNLSVKLRQWKNGKQ